MIPDTEAPDIEATAFLDREAVADLVQVLRDPHPCDGCAHLPDCGTGKACRDFAVFVLTGRVEATARTPTTAQYRRLFPESRPKDRPES
ncbi:hypothetical protein SAMN02949497_4393 [Methylomagnum ishizawai]|uniref:Uncharacterized protein n=1 Tax=Methylomagnum ishizawai TaxID=1760988 RepID=A0A1Y6DA32_9GAMM|nr:hypothetical protein [Methylomagnum ishizawai]SMF96565.1 hypothetical protein SAMN02949497_3967 [Methylomagnum ishizawai]SMF96979.1 hypothetical protein SAMN02949497_4393 [Methylomagnum ishizawai]